MPFPEQPARRTFRCTGIYGFLLLFIFLLTGLKGFSQEMVITGKVMDGERALPNVSVMVKETGAGTKTDSSGNFSIKAARGADLVFSYVGYQAQEIKVTGSAPLHIALTSLTSNLNDVVVVGYGTKKRSDVTGAVASVPKSRLTNLPVTNVAAAMEGAVAGLNITTTSSVPGSSPSIVSRGVASLGGGSDPYLVVDGIPVIQTAGGNFNNINPNDIESIEILKDASATAIYGVNGANGVILITTKRGKSGKPVIAYNSYVGTENFAHKLTPRSGPDYVQKYADYMKQTNQTQTSPVPNAGELAFYQQGKTTDWLGEATQQGIITDNTLSISGGTTDVKYYVAGEYLNQKGVIRGYQYHRASIRSNLDVNVTKFLTVGMSSFVTGNNYDGGRANFLFATAMSPYANPYNSDGTFAIYPMNPELLYTNPLLGLNTDRLRRTVNVTGNAYADVKFSGIFSGLKYRLNAGYIYFPERYASYTGRAANDLNGTASVTDAHTTNYTLENILTYNKDWADHHIDITALYSAQERNYLTTTAGAVGFVNDQLSFNNLGAGATQTSSTYSDRYGANSQMGRINYSYKGKYLLTLTARRDGVTVFGSNTSKYGLFPVAAVAWNISKEAFLEKSNVVSNLRLRASYGKVGNQAIGVYNTISTNSSVRYPFNGLSTIGVVSGNLGNSNLHWENAKTLNVGLEFGFLKNRIAGNIDYYSTNTYDLLLWRSLPIITGYSSVLDNLGQMSNKGIELTLNTQNVITRDFSWSSTIVFARNKNKIVDLYGDRKDDLGNRWFIGQPLGVVYDYVMDGIWQNGEDVSKQDPGAKPGDIKFRDLNGDGKITTDDRQIIGQVTPKWTGGLTNTFRYRNFSMNIFVQTAQGITKNNTDISFGDETGRRNTPAVVTYWTPTNGNNDYPSLAYNNTRGYGWGRNASYTRIKDITLSYMLPQSILDKAHIGSCTVYLSGRNLYTFTQWVGWDPENNYSSRGSGDWTNNYPLTRSFVLGVNISLK